MPDDARLSADLLPAAQPQRARRDRPPRPVDASAYLRLRREAAGLSVRHVAGMLAREADQVATALDLVHALETPGNTARRRETLESLGDVFAFDIDVYHQLANEPVDRHPAICRGCGCSEWDRCMDSDHGACSWATPTACTRCLPDADAQGSVQ